MTQTEFEESVIAMQDTLYRISATILTAECDREDAIQESIYKALKNMHKLRDDRAFRSWMIRILVNESYDILRRRKRECPWENPPEPEPEPGADVEVFRLLFTLEDKLRLPVVLKYVEGYSVNEIAVMLQIPAGTVKSRLSRARQRLKKELIREGADVCRI